MDKNNIFIIKILAGFIIFASLSSLACSAIMDSELDTLYTISYDDNGADNGKLSKTSEQIISGAKISIAPTGFSRNGYTLSGWNTDADGNGTPFLFGTTTVTRDLTLYAQWQKSTEISKIIFDDELKMDFTAFVKTDKEEKTANVDTSVDVGNSINGSSIRIELSADSAWGGGYVQNSNGVDVSDCSELAFALNTSRLDTSVDYIEFKLEDTAGNSNSVNVFDLNLSKTHGEWKMFSVDLSEFSNVNFLRLKAIGFWHPRAGGATGVYKPGLYYIDDVIFTGESTVENTGEETIYSNLVWSDEFNGQAIDSTNWTYDIGTGAEKGLTGWGNNELQYYTSRADNARIEDLPGGGRGLVIEARKESYNGNGYTSARLLTQGLQEWTYGRIEARIKLPVGQGIWPAFWMLGSNILNNPWPECGEIDIMEYLGHSPSTVHGTIHYGNPYGYVGDSYTLSNGSFSDEFHVFAIEWKSGEIGWSVDGVTYQVKRNWNSSLDGGFPAPFNRPFFILLNLAVGGNWPGNPDATTTFPQKMYVDWVRVYQ